MRTLIATIFLACGSVMAQTRSSAGSPSLDELHGLLGDGKYQDVIKQTTRILALRGEAAALYDKHDVLVLKAEAHLRLYQNPAAIEAFADAAAVAPDEHSRDVERATVMLIEKCKRSTYTPQVPGDSSRPKSIDILDTESRKVAFEALLADERAEIEPRLQNIVESSQIPPMLAAAERIARMRTVERAATGAGMESDKMLEPISKRARSAIESELDNFDDRIAAIDKSANKKKKMGSHYRKQGLSSSDPRELRSIIETCKQVETAAQTLAAVIPDDADKFDEIRLKAQDLSKRAQLVLAADYSGNFDRS